MGEIIIKEVMSEEQVKELKIFFDEFFFTDYSVVLDRNTTIFEDY